MTEFRLVHRGKVRDSYSAEGYDGLLVLVASDRISAYDVVMGEGVPSKGRLLTALSDFWFETLRSKISTQLFEGPSPDLPKRWRGRATLVKKAQMVPVECVVRGYLAGSAYLEYREFGTIGGHRAPANLRLGSSLPEAIFTPTTKEEEGHDRPLAPGELPDLVGKELAEKLEELTVSIYHRASTTAEGAGLVLADTKFEFGYIDGELSLCDEVLTPDSSRYWRAADISEDREPPQLDKQVLRDWLTACKWDKTSSPPKLPSELVDELRANYREIYERITGKSFDLWPAGESDEAFLGEQFRGVDGEL